MTEPNRKDYWDKAQILGNIAVTVVIGVVGYFVTMAISESESENAVELAKLNQAFEERQSAYNRQLSERQAESDRITSLLPLLASANITERAMAIEVALRLDEEGMLPEDLITSLVASLPRPAANETSSHVVSQDTDETQAPNPPSSVANSKDDPEEREAKERLYGLEEQIAQQFPRLYFYAKSMEQRKSIKGIAESFKDLGYKRRSVFVNTGFDGAETEIRYFHKEDESEANLIQAHLAKEGLKAKTKYSKYYVTYPRHFEVWLSETATKDAHK